jgi:hypothetical protein
LQVEICRGGHDGCCAEDGFPSAPEHPGTLSCWRSGKWVSRDGGMIARANQLRASCLFSRTVDALHSDRPVSCGDLKRLHVQLANVNALFTMSKVLSTDSNEHSTPLSNNKGRRGTNVPLLSSVSLLDNADNNAELSAARQPSPIVSQGLISCFNCRSILRNVVL